MHITEIPATGKRKFLKTIYEIQKAFGSEFGHISRNFSFGIKPTLEEQKRLEVWFSQVANAKKELYKEIFADYKKRPHAYLQSSFDYATFFKGNPVYSGIKKDRHLIKSQPVIEGLGMEIAGTIRSFITNNKRLYDENIQELTRIEKTIVDNRSKIGPHNIENEDVLLAVSKTLVEYMYEEISASFQKLEDFDRQLTALNEAIAKYNYEVNQLNTGHRLGLSLLNKLNRMPSFPSVTEKEDVHVPEILAQLTDLAGLEPDPAEVAAFFKRSAKRISRRAAGKRMRFEDRLLAYLIKKYGSGLSTDKAAVVDLAEHLGKQLSSLETTTTANLTMG